MIVPAVDLWEQHFVEWGDLLRRSVEPPLPRRYKCGYTRPHLRKEKPQPSASPAAAKTRPSSVWF